MRNKAAIWVLCLLCLCGCRQELPAETPSAEPETVQAEPALQEVPLQILKPVEMEVLLPPDWRGSEPQQGDPITPQPGDTAESWNPDLTANYPADADCAPAELREKWLAAEGLTDGDLAERNCGQLVLVAAGNNAKTITTCYSLQEDGSWLAEENMTAMAGYVGKQGIAHDRRRGSNQSPAGLWPLGSAFGLNEPPEDLKVPWRQITDRSDWVTDKRSLYFNTWQERDDPDLVDSWNDAEHLADYTETYTYACIIEYNTPPYTVANRGCAIFLHVSDHPTEGCVGLLEADMVQVLQWLNPRSNPHILITGKE